jgi:prepilin-type N-terminal cleavage/methylation domain-containing protein
MSQESYQKQESAVMDNLISSKVHFRSMRDGWTVIELIFVILIIAILASIAIGKLSTTRDDAKLSATVASMSICIQDVATHYAATNQDYTEENHPASCDEQNTVCYDIVYAVNGRDFNVTLDPTGTDSNNDTHRFCTDIENVGGHLAKSYNFGGSSVNRY